MSAGRTSRVLDLLSCPAPRDDAAAVGNTSLIDAVIGSPAHAYLVPTKSVLLAELNSWLALTLHLEVQKNDATVLQDHYQRINEFLLPKTFLVGESLTLADVCVFDCLMTVGQCFEFPNIARYLRHGELS